MTDAREALVARQREEFGESWDVLVPEVGWTLGRIIESTIEDVLAEFDVTPRGEVATDADWREAQALVGQDGNVPESAPTTRPSVEDVARACGDPGSVTPRREGESVPRWSARAVLALLPGRTEAEVKAEALREAAIYAPGGPRVSGWLRKRAGQWEETNRG